MKIFWNIFVLSDFIEQLAGEVELPSEAPAENLQGDQPTEGEGSHREKRERELSPDGDSDSDQDSMKLVLEESPEKKPRLSSIREDQVIVIDWDLRLCSFICILYAKFVRHLC